MLLSSTFVIKLIISSAKLMTDFFIATSHVFITYIPGTTTLASEYAYAAPYSQYSPYGGPYSHSAATGLLSKW